MKMLVPKESFFGSDIDEMWHLLTLGYYGDTQAIGCKDVSFVVIKGHCLCFCDVLVDGV